MREYVHSNASTIFMKSKMARCIRHHALCPVFESIADEMAPVSPTVPTTESETTDSATKAEARELFGESIESEEDENAAAAAFSSSLVFLLRSLSLPQHESTSCAVLSIQGGAYPSYKADSWHRNEQNGNGRRHPL